MLQHYAALTWHMHKHKKTELFVLLVLILIPSVDRIKRINVVFVCLGLCLALCLCPVKPAFSFT